ncbi:hypothetical protein [Flavobacterium sp. CLA17]|uniref:hypothetical protein n=1 Tax=Flavobacterium sp. CLA17 TaxID=2724135 RepID=UPI001493002E|nr:hypothetical protein [Flavobacterium sp. CLA17]QSB26928.1 hypothetical protein HAV12_021600 [Flavobacterium sp. CLA17]
MKKLLYLLSAIIAILTSCSSDNDTDSLNQAHIPLLLKYVITKDGKTIYTGENIYNGNRIVSFSDSNGNKSNYTYTGDLITKIEDINTKGMITRDYSYSSGKLESVLYKSPSSKNLKIKYTHNQDGTISYKKYLIQVSTGSEEEEGSTGKYTFKDGNLIKTESFYYNSPEGLTISEYDSKNSFNKNILGLKLLLDYSSTSINNLVKQTIVTFSDNNSTSIISTYAFTYDANGYATEMKTSKSDGASNTTQTIKYFY